ncbi:MAG: cob(I)yrinic acid a,c-diamide adenosyltransferase [Verrucomicrobiota bacterium]
MSIATKTGDNGSTALMYGRRVSKTHPRIAANGACDELNAALGMARAFCDDALVTEPLFSIQKELVLLMGELAVDTADLDRYKAAGFELIGAAMVDRLTGYIDDLEKNHRISFKHWATPGALRESAFLDLARTVCRRAERAVVELGETGWAINPESVRYLNRLSDLCWLYARYLETRAGV